MRFADGLKNPWLHSPDADCVLVAWRAPGPGGFATRREAVADGCARRAAALRLPAPVPAALAANW
jgi:hypothetical protein